MIDIAQASFDSGQGSSEIDQEFISNSAEKPENFAYHFLIKQVSVFASLSDIFQQFASVSSWLKKYKNSYFIEQMFFNSNNTIRLKIYNKFKISIHRYL